jgi:hypothetical protein
MKETPQVNDHIIPPLPVDTIYASNKQSMPEKKSIVPSNSYCHCHSSKRTVTK